MSSAVTTVFGAIPIAFGAGLIPAGSESAGAQVSTVDPVDHTQTTHPIEGYFNGLNIQIGGTIGTLRARAYSGAPGALGTVQLYEATFAYTVASTTLSDSLGAELVVYQAGCYITLEGSVGGMEAIVNPYLMGGTIASKI